MKAAGNKLERGFGFLFGVWTDKGYKPPLLHRILKPKNVTGNQINGLGEQKFRKPVKVYHIPGQKNPFRLVNITFLVKATLWLNSSIRAKDMVEAWQSSTLDDIAPVKTNEDPQTFTAQVKEKAKELGAFDVGITAMRDEWTYQNKSSKEKWIIMLAIPMDHQNLADAPYQNGRDEVSRAYDKGHWAAHGLSNWLRGHGWPAHGHGSFLDSNVLMIPAAIAAGLGELGKHGSMIHRKLGSSFRLAFVLTDAPLIPDEPEEFGADEFCASCQVCAKACPPNAISHDKQMIRGVERYYVDFDKCVPFFNDSGGCAICIAACPWSRPGVADNLVLKMARKRGAQTN